MIIKKNPYSLAIYLGLFLILVLTKNTFGQGINDYQTDAASVTWSTAAHWQIWNGTAWVVATEYPGESAGNANQVTVRDGHTATLTADVPNAIGSLVVGEGVSGVLTSDHVSDTRVLDVVGALTGDVNSQILLRGISLTVGTTSLIDGVLTDDNNAGVVTFGGLVTISGTGFFTSTAVTASGNMNFSGGIANTGNFSSALVNFTGTQTISGGGTYNFGGDVLIAGGFTVINEVSDLTIVGNLDGVLSTWINDDNTTFRYEGALAPMVSGTLTSNNAGSNFYYSLNGNQNIKAGSYYNLLMSAGGTKTSTGNITVGNDWDLASGVIFDPASNDFTSTAGVSNLRGILADGIAGGTTTLGGTNFSGTIDGSATGVVDITGAVNLDGADPIVGRGTITFTNTLTIPATKTIIFNANAPTGVKTFGTVIVDNGGFWVSFSLTTKSSLVVGTAFTNNGSSTFGGATISGTLTSVNDLAFPKGLDATGALQADVTGNLTTGAASLFASNLTLGASTVYTMNGAAANSVGGNLVVANGTDLIVATTGAFDVTGTTYIDGDFTDNNDAAATTFTGLVTVDVNGTFTSTLVTTLGNMNFSGGIANTGTFSSDDVNFNGTQTISGGGTYAIAGDIIVDGAVTVTNQIPSLTVSGVFNGNNVASTWINDAGTDFHYQNATEPMATGVLNSNCSSSFHYDLNGAQSVKSGAYCNLLMSAGGTKTSTGNITVGNDWDLASGVIFDPVGADFSVTGSSTLAGTFADSDLAGTSTLGAVDISGGTIDGSATGVVNVTGAVTLPTADPTLGRGTISFNNAVIIPSGRTITFNADAAIGVKSFGAVVVDAGGTWTSTLLNSKPSLVISTAFTNNGTTSFGGTTFSDGATLTSVNSITFPNGADGVGTLNLFVTGTVDFQDGSSIATNLVSGGNTSTIFSGGNSLIGGTYNVASGRMGTVSTTGTFGVTGASQIDGSFLDNENTSTTTFGGLVTISGIGSCTSTAVTTLGNMNFSGGIANTGTFSSDDVNFNGTQTISGAGTYTIAGDIMVDGAVTVTNQIPSMTVAGVFNGNNASSTWVNDAGTDFYYQNATQPMAMGVLNSNCSSSFHYDLNGAQSVKGGAYCNLLMSTGGTKTLVGAAATVAEDWTLAAGVVFDPASNDFTSTAGVSNLRGILADGIAGGTTTLGGTNFSGTIDGIATGVVDITGAVNLDGADPIVGRGTITFTNTLTIPATKTITFNANAPTGVKTFGTAIVDNGGFWDSSVLTTKSSLVVGTAFTNNGNSTFGGANISGTLTSVNDLVFPNGLDAAGALQADVTGNLTTGAASLFAFDLTLGASTVYTMNGAAANSVGGNLVVANGTDLIVATAGAFDVTGATYIDGDFTDNNDAAATTFTGLVTVDGNGTLTSTLVTTLGNMNFSGGIANTGTFSSDDVNFNGTQTISGAGTYTIAGDIMVDGAITVTNQIPSMTVSGVFNGNDASSTWINDDGTDFYYQNATEPMAMGVLNSNCTSSFHYDLNGAQSVKSGAYCNLLMSAGGTKTLVGGAATVAEDWTLAAGVVFDPDGDDFSVTGSSVLTGTLADGNPNGTTILNAVDMSNGTIDGAAEGVVEIQGALTMPTVAGTATIGQVALNVTGAITVPNTVTLEFNANSPNGLKEFSDVTVASGGTWNSVNMTAKGNLVVSNSFDNQFNQTTFGGATMTGTLTSVTDLDFPDGLDGVTTLTINATGVITVSAAGSNTDCSFDNLTLGSSTVLTFLGANNADHVIRGDLVVGAGTNLNISNNRDFDIMGTSAISGTLTRTTAGNAGQDMTFGGVATVNAGGVMDMTAVTNNDHVYFAAGLTNAGTCTFADRVRFGAGSVLTATTATVFPDGMNCLVGGSLTIAGPGTVTDNKVNSNTVFNGQLIIAPDGSYDASSRVLTNDVQFEAGIEQNNTAPNAFLIGRARFSVNDQAITGAGDVNILDDVRVDNNRTVTNNNTGSVIVSTSGGRIDAQNAASTWIQGPNSNLVYAGTVRPMDAGTLDASGMGNTVTYNTTALTQDVKESFYFNLVFSPANNADAFGALTVINQLTLTTGTFDNGGNLTMSDNSTISRGLGSLTAAPTFGANVNIIYTANLTTGFEMPTAGATSMVGVLQDLTFNTSGAEVTLGSAVSVKGNVTWTSDALVNLLDNDFRFGTGTITGNGVNAYLKTNGGGKFVKEGTGGADFQITYPVGNTYYSPCQVTAMNAGAGDVLMRVVGSELPYITVNQNGISKYWEISNTAGANAVSATFTFEDPQEVVGNVALYQPQVGDGVNHALVSGPSPDGQTPTFAMNAHPNFTGDFTYIDATIQTPKTFWSFQSGNWNDPTSWSTTAIGWTNVGNEYPGQIASGDSAIIKNAHNITGNVSIRVGGLNILAGGILDVGTQTGHLINNLNGQGTVKLNSLTLPTVVNNSGFVASGGGTIEYYNIGGTGSNLSTNWMTYNNLTISNNTGTDHLLILQNQTNPSTYTLNGDLSITSTGAGTATMQLGNTATNIIDLSIGGDLNLSTNAFCTVGSFNAIHTVNLTGDITNNGTIDWCNTAQYQQFVNVTSGAVRLIAQGASDKLYTCNGPTDVFQLQLFLGVDETYVCEINPSVAANWRVFSLRPAGVGHGGSDTPTAYNFDLAYFINKGTLKFSGASYVEALGRQNDQFRVEEGDRIWLESGTLDLTIPGISDGTIRMTRTGELKVTGGTLNIGDDGFNFQDRGVIRIEGGIVNTTRLLNMYPGDGDASFIMSGGTLNLLEVDTEGSNYLSRFSYTNPICGVNISGGTINVYDPMSTTNMDGGTLAIMSSAATVTGGTWNFYLPGSNVDMKIAVAIPMWDVNIYKQGPGTSRLLLSAVGATRKYVSKRGLTILNNLTIHGTNAPVFDANGETVTVGGNLNIVAGGTYQGASQTIFTGSNASTFTIGSTQSNTTDLSIQKTGAGSVTMAGAGTFDCIKNLDVTGGTFDIGGTLPLDVAGNITNLGIIQGGEQLRLQRGVVTANITAAAAALPTMTNGGGAGATFDITVKDGRIIDVKGSGGAGYGNGDRTSMTVLGTGVGAVVRCRCTNNIDSCWVQSEGTGYGPTGTISGGGGAGATAAAVLTGDQGAVPTLTLEVVNPGEGYTSPATYTITGAATADDVTVGPTLSGGTFTNLSLNNYQGATATSHLTLTGNLRLANGNLAMSQYALNLGTASNIYDALTGVGTTFNNTKMVTTGGLASNGGIAKAFNGLCFLYPQGIGTDYMEEYLCFSGVPGAYGTITIKPVSGEHPLVSATGQSLTAYWNIRSSGTTVAPATVSHTMKYADAQVVDNGGTVLESQYVAGRYAVGATSWTADAAPFVNAGTNTGTVSGATFNAVIDGDYSFGDQTPNDPFNTVTTFYSRTNGNYDDPMSWSIDATAKHGGGAAARWPGLRDVVIIGDGAGINHTMTVPANGDSSAFITIAPGSTLDLGSTTGHNFGSYSPYGASDGVLRISSTVASAEFPAGDWSNFNDATGGKVEYYDLGFDFTIPTTNAAPTSAPLNQYRSLTLSPGAGNIITMPDIDLSVLEDFTVQGVAAGDIARLNTASSRIMTIGQDFMVTSGRAQFRSGFAQNVDVGRNVEVAAGARLLSQNGGVATSHLMEIGGDLVNDGIINFNRSSVVDLTFVGTGNTSIRGITGGAATTLNKVTVNKGTDQTAVMDVTVQGVFTPLTNQWLTLLNGTFRYSLANTIYLNDANNGVALSPKIPATSCLSINNAGATMYITEHNNGANDLYLDGKLEIIDGSVIVGTGNLTNGGHNDIEYATTGTPAIDIQGGSLYVNGQIRRDRSLAAGDLTYNQSGGTVTVGGRSSSVNYGQFELLNNGVFNMSAGTIIINRTGTTNASLADFYLNPASSNVTGGTIQFGVTGDNSHNNQLMSIRSSVPLHHITVDGNAGDTVAVKVNIAPLTIHGTLTILNDNSAFNCNGADLNFAADGVLVNNNTRLGQGVLEGGFYPGVVTQTTTFQSTTAAQSITGSGTNTTNFGNLVINNAFGNVSLAAGNIAVNNDLTITTTLADGGQTVNAKGNIVNNGTHLGVGSITMNGTAQQDISGTGTFENIGLNNAAGATANSDLNLNGVFTLTDGVLDLNNKLLDLQTGASFAPGAPFSATNMVILTGAQSDLGVRKNLAAGATDITYPIGVTGKYCPVRHNVTANTAVGTVTIKMVNTSHPSTQDPNNKELDFYWNVSSTGLAGLSVDHYYTYEETDVNGTEAAYNIGVFRNSNWDPAHGLPGVNAATNLMTLAARNYFDGDWTAGESNAMTTFEFATLATFYSRQSGAWNDHNTWSTASHAGAAVPAGDFPGGNPTIIATGHDVTVTNNSRITPSLQINGNGSLDLAATFGHNFGDVSGTGSLRVSGTGAGTFFLPLGDFTSFVADGAGTWVYYGSNNGTLPAQFEYNNLLFIGASTKSFALGDVIINSDFTIAGGTASNTLNNVNLSIEGDWTNSTGGSGFMPGTGTVSMTSTVNRSMIGSTEFYNLTVDNTGGTVGVTGGKTVNNALTMTNGLLDFDADTLVLGPTGTISGSGFSAAKMIRTGGVYTDGGVFMNCNTNPRTILLPIGSGGLYTPASYNITAAGSAGTIHVRPVAAAQPYTNDVNNLELTYYWNVRSTGLTGLTLSQAYTYDDSDVQGTEANYRGGHFVDSLDWTPVNGHVGSVNTGTNVISIPSGSVVAGDYTAGESDGAVSFEFGPPATYYSITDGNYSALATWSTDAVLQHTGAAANVLPRSNNNMVVGNTHNVTTASNNLNARSMEVEAGGSLLLGVTTGHIFSDINGSGTIRINCVDAGTGGTYSMPEGDWTDFAATSGGTINFISNCGASTLPDTLTYGGLELTGGNTISFPGVTSLTLNGGMTISGAGTILSNIGTNIPFSVKGAWTNSAGFTGYAPGTETVTFDGTVAQAIDGNTNFGSLGVNNAAVVTIDDSVNIAGTLAFTDGILALTNNMLLMQGGPGNITGYGPTAYVGTNETARLKILNVAAVPTHFPIGTLGANNFAEVILTNTVGSGAFWVSATDSIRLKGTQLAYALDTSIKVDAVNKTWYIKTDVVNPVVDAVFTWHSSAELPGFDRNNCGVQKHYNKGLGNDWRMFESVTAFPRIPLTPNYYTASASGMTTFSPHGIGPGDGALPVELLYFNAIKNEEVVDLTWSTGSEIDNDLFEIERSSNGVVFQKIAELKGAGNTMDRTDYEFVDYDPLPGVSYYRLKQVDFDGSVVYSYLKSVKFDADPTFDSQEIMVSLFPNPVAPSSPFSIELTDVADKKEVLVVVVDVAGREFYSKVVAIANEENKLIVIDPRQRLEPGVYLVTGSMDNSWFNKKLIVR